MGGHEGEGITHLAQPNEANERWAVLYLDGPEPIPVSLDAGAEPLHAGIALSAGERPGEELRDHWVGV